MATQSIIKHSLTVAIRLINSVTGNGIKERNAVFYQQGKMVKPISKGDGVYLFINTERIDFELAVHVHGYEPGTAQIRFEDLKSNYPVRELYLIPEDTPSGGIYLSLQGLMKGMTAIEAVSLNENVCSLKEYENRKQIMTISNPKNVRLSDACYGLLNSTRTQFEKFEILEQNSASQVKILQPLNSEWSWNNIIVRIIPGQVDNKGNYLLRVAEASNAVYLVHYIAGGEDFYQTVDFNQPEELKKGAKKDGGRGSKRS